jgi:hypothetical protein
MAVRKCARTSRWRAPESELLPILPADGIAAAVNLRGDGMSRWQLSDENTAFLGDRELLLAGSWRTCNP